MHKKLKKKAQKEHRAATRNERLKLKLKKHGTKEPKLGKDKNDSVDVDMDGAIIEGKKHSYFVGEEGGIFTCHVLGCAKLFQDSSSLRKHLMTHGERQYICPVDGCNKRFLDNSKLKRH